MSEPDFPYGFAVGRHDDAAELVRRHHYSGRPAANLQVVGTWHEAGGLFGDRGPAVAACCFSIPPTRWSESILELTRLVRTPTMTRPLSNLVALTVDHVRFARAADLLVSFADQQQGHHGGIYQAASWRYGGQRERCMDGLIINGQFTPGRTCNRLYGTRSPVLLRARRPNFTVEPHYDEGKHIYWRSLNRHGERQAVRLGLQTLPFPKPEHANRPGVERETIPCEPVSSTGVRSNISGAAA